MEAYIQGISTRSVDELVKAMDMSGISKRLVSRLCEEIDQRVKAFLDRPIESDWLYRVASCRSPSSSRSASTLTAGARCWAWISAPPRPRPFGRRSCASWRGVVCAASSSSSPAPMKASRRLSPRSSPRLGNPVHFMRNALAHAGRSERRVVSAFIAAAFAQDDAKQAKAQWRRVADQLGPKLPKLAALMDHAEPDVLAYMGFPSQHRAKLHSTSPIERLNGEIKRRTEVVGIFPNEVAITRLVGAILLEQNDEWAVQRSRYITLESMAPVSDDPLVGLPAAAA